MPTGSALTFAGGLFDLNGFNRTITTLTGTGGLTLGSAVLSVNQAAASNSTGPITDTGNLTRIGARELTLTAANSYSGGINVSAGTLRGDTVGLQGAIANASAVVFDQGVDGSYGSVTSGLGGVTPTGTGVVQFSGANTYTGGTTVGAGTLSVDGSVLGELTVLSGATLAGKGSAGW